ncbi:MAG TPA: hypothetical protein VHZ95_01060, partial [Polyangiales bacterium]|nr:hypothetical protein [Polyangiales bacterium]
MNARRSLHPMNAGVFARALPAIALIALLVVWIAAAWICDDAFITFRTVQNLWHGDGLTWNPGQRVQAYTHPAWMLLCALGYGLSSECYVSALGLSLVLTFATALALIYPLRASPLMAATLIFVLSASSAFVQYTSSGLENPLLFFLLVLFSAEVRRVDVSEDLTRPALLASAIALTRIDALVLIGPACLALLPPRKSDRRRALLELSLGASPLLAWEIFSLVYYGAFVPNTAIAKLNVEVPAEQLYGHGAAYLVDSLSRDPLTLGVALAAALLLARRRQRQEQATVLGLLLYVVYLLRIGGDFMSGRFCGSLLVLALAALSRSLEHFDYERVLLAGVIAYAALWPNSPWHIQLEYGHGLGFADVVQPNGIADERAFYYPSTGLLRVLSHRNEIAEHDWPM